MPEKTPFWADALLTVWGVVVGVFYFGGYFFPQIGALTANASAFYALMVLVTVLVLAFRYLHSSETAPKPEAKRTKKRK